MLLLLVLVLLLLPLLLLLLSTAAALLTTTEAWLTVLLHALVRVFQKQSQHNGIHMIDSHVSKHPSNLLIKQQLYIHAYTHTHLHTYKPRYILRTQIPGHGLWKYIAINNR